MRAPQGERSAVTGARWCSVERWSAGDSWWGSRRCWDLVRKQLLAVEDEQTSSAINRLRETFERQFDQVYSGKWRGVSRVRRQQRTWLSATRKYPDFLEIGLDVWDNVYDWHVAYQQPLNVTRLADGRYAMAFMFTTLLLRPDQAADFVGYPFDADSQGRTP